jgi:hypothetical protein
MARTATNSRLQQGASKARGGSPPLGRVSIGRSHVVAGGRRIAADFRTPSLGMNVRLYRLYTELKNETGLRDIQAALDRRFPGYTISFRCCGRYQGTSEQSVVIDLLTHDERSVTEAAAEICSANVQECVLVIKLPVLSTEFVTATTLREKGLQPNQFSEQSMESRKLHLERL